MKIFTSKIFTVNGRDIVRALLMAALTPVIFLLQNAAEFYRVHHKWDTTLTWENLAMTAVGGAVAYLIKQFFSPSKTIIKEVPNENI